MYHVVQEEDIWDHSKSKQERGEYILTLVSSKEQNVTDNHLLFTIKISKIKH